MLINKTQLKISEMELNNKIELDTIGSFWLNRGFYLIQAMYEIQEFEFSIDLQSLQEYKIVKIQEYLYNLPGYNINTYEQDAVAHKNHSFVLMTIIGDEYSKQYVKSIEHEKI